MLKQEKQKLITIEALFDLPDKINQLLIKNECLKESHQVNKRLEKILGPSRLNQEALGSAINNLENFYSSLNSAIECGVDLKDPHQLTKHWMRFEGLKVSNEFYEYSNDKNVIIECYNLLNIQCFRNISFMNICSYSLAELLLYSWPELFERSSMITEHCLKQIKECIYNMGVIQVQAPTHLMKERHSVVGRVHEVKFEAVAPVFDSADVLWGYMVSTTGTIKDKYPVRHDLRFL